MPGRHRQARTLDELALGASTSNGFRIDWSVRANSWLGPSSVILGGAISLDRETVAFGKLPDRHRCTGTSRVTTRSISRTICDGEMLVHSGLTRNVEHRRDRS